LLFKSRESEYNNYKMINIKELVFKPTTEMIGMDIHGIEFYGMNSSPNVYVIKVEDDIEFESFIQFYYKGILYQLDNVIVHKKDDLIFLECRKWKETSI